MKGLESEVYAGGLEGSEEQLGARREVKLFPREASLVLVRGTPSQLDSVVPGVDLGVVGSYPWGTQEGTPQMRFTDGS